MPSWKAHREIGKLICNFYSSEIDKLIDKPELHDASRYDIGELEKIVKEVKEKYGEKGLHYLALHHYVDRLADILVRELSDGYESYVNGEDIKDIFLSIREFSLALLRIDPKNIFSLLIYDFETIKQKIGVLYPKLKGKRRRELIERLKSAYEKLQTSNTLLELRSVVLSVLKRIEQNFDYICLRILMDESFNSPRFLNRICQSIRMKSASYNYQGLEERAGKLMDQNNLQNFILAIIEMFSNNYKAISE